MPQINGNEFHRTRQHESRKDTKITTIVNGETLTVVAKTEAKDMSYDWCGL
jgi:hypothetical protein